MKKLFIVQNVEWHLWWPDITRFEFEGKAVNYRSPIMRRRVNGGPWQYRWPDKSNFLTDDEYLNRSW